MQTEVIARMREVGDEIKELDAELREVEEKFELYDDAYYQTSHMNLFLLVKQKMTMLKYIHGARNRHLILNQSHIGKLRTDLKL